MSWKSMELKNIFDLQNGYAFKSSEYVEDGYFVMRITNVQNGYISPHNPKYAYIQQDSKTEKFILAAGDILISLTGDVGRVGIVKKEHLPCVLNQRVARLCNIQEVIIDRNFLFHYLNGALFRHQVEESAQGAAQANVSTKNILALKMPLPPLPVQKQIVEKLDEAFADIDKAISATQKNIANAEAFFQRHLVDVFNNDKAGWEKTNLENLSIQITDGKHGDCKNKEMSGYYFLSAKDIKHGTLQYEGSRQIEKTDFEETHRRTNLEPGDVLITNSGTIGRMAIASDNKLTSKTTFQKSVAIIKPIHEKINSKFLYFVLRNKLIEFQNISRGAAQKNLLLRDLRSFEITIPTSIRDQLRISDSLEEILDYCLNFKDIFSEKLCEIHALKSSILNQAFSGELTKDAA